MSVILSKHPSRAVELLEYLSLIRYAAKYHRGLGWCTYDVKFPQKAAANKSALWSVIDSQLWLKTFTVASSPLKEGIFFSNRDPHPRQVHLEGTSIVLATTSTRVSSVLGPLGPLHTSATSQVVKGITPGTGVPPSLNPLSNHSKGRKI